ncbi:period circadian protein-like [Sarcophilus harrisii]|uniref:period circadian protein-like n=1 Tax=Sarcophilus harrisii TaxID=9305 RepID=UPI001301C204|nr:period circadian protein-like [Sarcophilus harrisii]
MSSRGGRGGSGTGSGSGSGFGSGSGSGSGPPNPRRLLLPAPSRGPGPAAASEDTPPPGGGGAATRSRNEFKGPRGLDSRNLGLAERDRKGVSTGPGLAQRAREETRSCDESTEKGIAPPPGTTDPESSLNPEGYQEKPPLT